MNSPALRRWLGAGLGPGFLPVAPGTWGSLATMLVLLALLGLEGWSGGVGGSDMAWMVGLPVFLVLLFWAGCRLGDRAEQDWGRPDPGSFVLDEVVGQGLAVLPLLPGPLDPLGAAVAFAAFRVFDIAKPPPCRQLEERHGGFGIMADDVAAGVYAAVVVLVVQWVRGM